MNDFLRDGFTEKELKEISQRKLNVGVGLRPSFVNELPPVHNPNAGVDTDTMQRVNSRQSIAPVTFQETVHQQRYSGPMLDAMENAFKNIIGMTIPKDVKL